MSRAKDATLPQHNVDQMHWGELPIALLPKTPWRVLSSAPSSPAEGEPYYDSTLHKLRVWDGSAWQNAW